MNKLLNQIADMNYKQMELIANIVNETGDEDMKNIWYLLATAQIEINRLRRNKD